MNKTNKKTEPIKLCRCGNSASFKIIAGKYFDKWIISCNRCKREIKSLRKQSAIKKWNR